MGKWLWIALVIAILACITGFLLQGGVESPVNENAGIISFSYSHSGSSTMEIYSYAVEKNRETGEMQVTYDLFCGYQTYTLPVDHELMLGLRALVKDHDLRKWDGFDKSNSLIADGSGFGLRVSFDDGTGITASGSNSFPEGYGEAAEAINDLFQGYLKKHGIDPKGGY